MQQLMMSVIDWTACRLRCKHTQSSACCALRSEFCLLQMIRSAWLPPQVDGSALGQHMEDFYLSTLKQAVLAANPALAGQVEQALEDVAASSSSAASAAAPPAATA